MNNDKREKITLLTMMFITIIVGIGAITYRYFNPVSEHNANLYTINHSFYTVVSVDKDGGILAKDGDHMFYLTKEEQLLQVGDTFTVRVGTEEDDIRKVSTYMERGDK